MSTLFNLIEEFSSREIIPVEVDEVVAYLRSIGTKDEIYFFDADIDTDVLKGTIVHWEYQMEGWTYKVADIYTARSLTLEEKRMVQAKELLHILDPRIDRANTPEEVEALIERMALQPSEVDWQSDGDHARSDRTALLYALLVLFPTAARELLLPQHPEKISTHSVAELVALPPTIVGFIMSEMWSGVYPRLMKRLAEILPIPDRVHAIGSDSKTIEIHSVPLEDDPYTYAKRLEERTRNTPKSADAYIIETRREKRTFSRADLIAFTQRTTLGRN